MTDRMNAKRSACDRCHRLKMQCQTVGEGRHCNRCRSANVSCNYSKPGRPGRPPTRVGAGRPTGQKSAPDTDTEPVVGVTTPEDTTAWKLTDGVQILPEHMVESLLEDQQASQPQYDFANLFTSTTTSTGYHQPGSGYTEWLGQLPPAFHATPSTPSDHHSTFSGETCAQATTVNEIMAPRFAEQDYMMQQLAAFQVTIARMMIDSEAQLGPARLEQEAAYVLESSAKFLDLIRVLPCLEGGLDSAEQYHRRRRSHASTQDLSPPNAAIFLQLTSISMRLIEMHHWLYSSIYRCLQQIPETMDHEKPPAPAPAAPAQHQPPPLLFAIAGVRLAPTPRFRLHMLVHTGVYHLSRILRVPRDLDAWRLDAAASEGLPDLVPLQTRILASEDQNGRMAKIRAVLDRLGREFGIHTGFR